MFYVGLDIHSKHVAMRVLDKRQGISSREGQKIHDALTGLAQLPDRFKVCYEASCGYGFYHDALRPLAVRVAVARPGHLRLIFRSKHKNDRHDAEKLAKLLYLGEVPTVHVPSVDVPSWRELITCRHLIEKRTMAKNGLRTLSSGGIQFPNSKTVGRYFGLVRKQDQSGSMNRVGHITKAASATVRRFLTEAAWQAVRRSPTVRAYFEPVRRDDPLRKKIARIATANYFIRVMYPLLRRGELWQENVAA